MPPLIEPRTLRGFRDYPPQLMIPRERFLESARCVYREFGFAPIDTPALEYAEVLLAGSGGETARQVYRFCDAGDRDVALRFDLTVPFARFAAQHLPGANFGTPFKRYALGPVWRGENPTAGRYREFWQCDFDTIGTTSVSADAEVLLVIDELFRRLEIERVTIRLNHRQVLSGLLDSLGLADKTVPTLRCLDKLAKIGADAVEAEMAREAGLTGEQARAVLGLATIQGTNAERLTELAARHPGSPALQAGVARLRGVLAVLSAVGVPESRVRLDFTIARGLDYYTGIVCETFLDDLPGIGSVCSGGRYDNLAGLYTKAALPGVGASLGVDRLLSALEELGHPWLGGRATPADVLVLQFREEYLGEYHRLAQQLRAAGIATEVYPDAKKPAKQFEYADKRKHLVALIAGPDEFAAGTVKLKHLATRAELAVAASSLVEATREMLSRTAA